MATATGTTTVEHEKGLHARPASVFVQTASGFDSDIEVSKPGGTDVADAQSSIGVIALGVEPGDTIRIAADGPDAEQAVERLVQLVENDFESDVAASSGS